MKFFSTVLASFIGISLLGVNAQECDRPRIRPNIHTMSDSAFNRYANAVKRLNSGPRPNIWDRLAQKHVEYYGQVHSNPIFLAWHRQFLYELESQLREIDSEVRLPYWDWTVHYNNINNDPVWNRYGKNGESSRNYCPRGGAFDGMGVANGSGNNGNGDKCYTRNDRFDDVISGPKVEINDIINDKSDYSFWERIEYGSHGRVHNGIGRDFAGHASPSDPLFWAHHAFVDKIWFDRQSRHSDHTFTYAISPRTPLPGYPGKEVWNVYDPFNLCYTYLENNFSWSNVRMQSVVTNKQIEKFTPIQLSPSISSAINSTKLNEEKDKYAQAFVSKNIDAPNTGDLTKDKSDGCKDNLFKPVSAKYVNSMNYPEDAVRRVERQAALVISQSNNDRCN